MIRSLNNMKNIQLLLILFLSAYMWSCKPSESSSDPVPSYTQWYAHKQNTDDTINDVNGYLYLSTKYTAVPRIGTSVSSITSIKGDFEIRVKYSSYHTSGSHPFSEVLGFSLAANGITPAIISGNFANTSMYITDTSSTTVPTFKTTTNRDGEFYVKRLGSSYTCWMRAGADTVYLNKTNYITQDVSMVFEIGALDNTTNRTSVHIDDFTITGGSGAVVSDSFDANNNITTD